MGEDKNRNIASQLAPGSPLFGLGYARPLQRRRFLHVSDPEVDDHEGPVAEEVPVAFVYNGRPHAVMMATPADFEDFAVGFTLSEQVVRDYSEIRNIEVVRHAQGVELQLGIGEDAAARLVERSRNLVGRTSCGLCGVELISDALRDIPPVRGDIVVEWDAIARAESELSAKQALNEGTGAMHAAAWARRDGEVVFVREDVGRHNALDKVIGALARSSEIPREGFLVITSRASYELVQKAAIAGVPLIAAVSRPTNLAIRLAESAGLALVGLLREGTANVYADPHNILALPRGARL
jgi:formate dehydrogenase accessory protein FdhD